MPETVDPRGAGPYGMPLDSSPDYGSRGRTNALRRRRRAALHSTKLTRALAERVDPSAKRRACATRPTADQRAQSQDVGA